MAQNLVQNEELRSQRRSPAPVMVVVDGMDEEFKRVGDIGPTGVGLITNYGLKVGDTVNLKMRFPDLWEELEVEAIVRWADCEGKVGLEIVFKVEDNERFEQMIDEQERLGRMAALC